MADIDYTYFIKPVAARRTAGIAREMTKLEYASKTKIISFAEGRPNESIFPFESMQVQLKDGSMFSIQRPQIDEALQYIPSTGYPPLVEILKEFTMKTHPAPNWDKRELIILNGSQEGLHKIFDMILEEGDPVLTQNPMYLGTEIVLRAYRPEMLAIDEDEYGMSSVSLLHILQNRKAQVDRKMPKILYVNATGANPTGKTVPEFRRKEIYEICCKYNILILEDDAYCFLNFSEEIPRSYLSMDIEGRVLRLDSFSKVVSAGIRVGWMVGPKVLVRNIELHIQSTFLHSSSLSQVVTDKLLRTWGLEKLQIHLNSVRMLYKARCDLMISVMDRHLKGLCEWSVPGGGMFVWIKVLDVDDIFEMIMVRAVEKGITFVPGHAFMADPTAPCSYVRVSYSRASPEDMERGIELLAEVIKKEKILQRKIMA